jgi:hypothetical protein
MGAAEWFVIGAIIVGAVDEIIARSSLKDNSSVQLIITVLKRLFPSAK